MGQCLCRKKRGNSDAPSQTSSTANINHASRPTMRHVPRVRPPRGMSPAPFIVIDRGGTFCALETKGTHTPVDVKELIRQTLSVIRDLVNKEDGWLLVIRCLVEAIPDNDPLGPAVITLFLDESPLATMDAVTGLLSEFGLGKDGQRRRSGCWHRNACIVIGSLAEKMAGTNSVSMCSPAVLQYLIDNLNPYRAKQIILFSLIALEKFAQTSENRLSIARKLEQMNPHPLKVLEDWLGLASLDPLGVQIAFCAQWSLDNVFPTPDRDYSCMSVDMSHINAMLNHQDVSEYLKIGPNGLEARCDVSSFESVRCTFEVSDGVWFYEAIVLTAGVMQIGFATKKSRFLNHEGYGIGDDENSVAYDGCRQLIWFDAHGTKHSHPPWKSGDVLGCLLNTQTGEIIFSLNGEPLTQPHRDFLCSRHPSDGIFAAASFMSFQQCKFNFGAEPFRYPPSIRFNSFNASGSLSPSQKTILPRRRRQQREEAIEEDGVCHICYAHQADTTLSPCGHDGFCLLCALQMEICPLCRVPVDLRKSTAAPGLLPPVPGLPSPAPALLPPPGIQSDV